MIQRVQHFRGVFVHPFKIKKFPVDHQKFQVVLVSNTAKEVKFVPIPTKDNFARKFLLAGSIKQFKPNQYVRKKAVRNKHLEFPCGTWKIHEINQPDMLDNKDELKIDQKSKVSWKLCLMSTVYLILSLQFVDVRFGTTGVKYGQEYAEVQRSTTNCLQLP